jgi:septum site-determining protein MinD
MVKLCENLRSEVDWVIVDSPAGIERGFRNAIAPADEVLVITNPEMSAVRDADRIIGLVEAEEKGPARLVINRINPGMVKRGDMLSAPDVVDFLAVRLIGIVPEDEAVLVSTNLGQPVVLNQKSRAGKAFSNIAKRLLGEDVPWMELDEKGGFFNRLGKMISGGS